jgi:sulfoxide reductase heme-binding subunit YedZ
VTRTARQFFLLSGSGLALAVGALVAPYPDTWERISVVSAWLCLCLLTAALLISPLQRARGESPPVNISLRRDLGIWAALNGLLHFYAGNLVAMNPVYIGQFVRGETMPPPAAAIRDQLFAAGSIVGLVIAIIFLLLLAISSDRALRWLGVKKWRRIQRCAHVALWLTVLHGIAFQVLELRSMPLMVLVVMSLAILAVQLRGRQK